MPSNHRSLYTVACLSLTLTAAAAAQGPTQPSAHKPTAASYSGVSRPEEIPVTTSAEGITQPVVFEPYNPTHPSLQARATEPALPSPTLPNPDGSYVGAMPVRAAAPAAAAPYSNVPAAASNAPDTWGSIKIPVVSSEPNPDEGFVTRVAGPTNQLPVGTLLKVILKRPLSTKTSRLGTSFTATLGESVLRDGRIVVPAGSAVEGKITEVHGGTRLSGAASIHLEPTSVTLPDGTQYRVHGLLIDTGLYNSTKIDREGTLERRGHPRETIAVLALTAGSGAAAGAVFGGAPGALIGGAIGAGISTAIWLKEDRQTELPAGTKLVFSLSAPLTVGLQ